MNGKLTQLELTDVRSYNRAIIPFSPGLTVIVGSSDSGKSNLVRTILSIIRNESAGSFIRTGTSLGEARLSFDDGLKVALIKGRRKSKDKWVATDNAYDVTENGKVTHHKSVGSGCPEPIARKLNLGEIDVGGDQVNINIARQFDGFFGVLASPSKIAKIAGSASGVDTLYTAFHTASERLREAELAKRDAKTLAVAAVDRYKTLKAGLGDDIGVVLAEGEETAASLKAAQTQLSQLRRAIADYIESTRAIVAARESMAGLPELIEELTQARSGLRAANFKLTEFNEAVMQYVNTTKELKGAKVHCEEARAGLDSARKAHDKAQAELRVCPSCGKPL